MQNGLKYTFSRRIILLMTELFMLPTKLATRIGTFLRRRLRRKSKSELFHAADSVGKTNRNFFMLPTQSETRIGNFHAADSVGNANLDFFTFPTQSETQIWTFSCFRLSRKCESGLFHVSDSVGNANWDFFRFPTQSSTRFFFMPATQSAAMYKKFNFFIQK